ADDPAHADTDHVLSVFLSWPGARSLHRPRSRNWRTAMTPHARRRAASSALLAALWLWSCPITAESLTTSVKGSGSFGLAWRRPRPTSRRTSKGNWFV